MHPLILAIIMHRLGWTLIYLAVAGLVLLGLIWLTTPAEAKTSTDQEMPAIRPEKPADAIKDRTRCIQQVRTVRILISPDGKTEYDGGFTVWTACE